VQTTDHIVHERGFAKGYRSYEPTYE